jgi:hypothetical protein
MAWGDPWTTAGSRFALPADVLRAVAQQESGMRPGAVSPRGAVGYMQVMPGTFGDMARKYGISGSPADPGANIMAGAGYLREMLDRYKNPAVALAAYNAGPGRVDEWVAGGWDGSIDTIPFAETKNYVSKLLPTVTGLLASPTIDVAPRPDPKPLQTPAAAPPAPAPTRGAPMPRDETGGLLDMADPMTEGLLGLGTTLLANSGYSKTPVTLGQALGAAGEAGLQGYQKARTGNLQRLVQGAQLSKLFREQARQDRIDQMLGDGSLTEGIPDEVRRAIALLPPEEQGKALVDWRRRQAMPDRGLTPFYATDADGNVAAFQLSGAGGAEEVRLPPGLRPAPVTRSVDTGTGTVQVGPGGVPVGPPIRRDIAGAKVEEARGEAEGQQIVDAPKALRTADTALGQLNEVLQHPGMKTGTGWGSLLNWMPASQGLDFQERVDQLKGGAFLEAFQNLKGGGAITQIEGDKATAAVARLNTAKDEASFRAALNELRELLQTARTRAAAKIPGGAQQPAAPPAAGGDAPKVRMRWNPETLELEDVP